MNKVYSFFLKWPVGLLSATAVATMMILTLMPGEEMPQQMGWEHLDKVAHGLMFGLTACAIAMDAARHRGRISLRMIRLIAAAVTGLGVVIELLQDAMGLGRSCEITDIAADAVGALVLPLVCFPLLKRYVALSECQLSTPAPDKIAFDEIKRIYMMSFPEEERRPWEDLTAKLTDRNHPLNIIIISHRGRPAGFITWWKFDGVRYVEHFAIDPTLRGRAIGSRAIMEFCEAKGQAPVVLEVEPAETSREAERRIRFYERCGFKAHHTFPYIQPPYAPGLPEVKLTLMTCGEPRMELAAMADLILRFVYLKDL